MKKRLMPSINIASRAINIVAIGVLAFLLSSCATVNANYNPAKKHHRPEGFQNNYTDATDKSRWELIKWNLEAVRQGLPKPPQTPTPSVAPDLKFIAANAGAAQVPAITWVGHATMLIQMGGLNILTDPHFSERASPFQWAGPKRLHAPGVQLKDLPRIDLVLISHNHYDHLDEQSVKALNAQAGGAPLFVVPLGVKAWMQAEGITNVRQMDWWDKDSIKIAGRGEVELHFLPTQHWSARGLNDRRATLWGAFGILAADFHAYFGGDSGYSADFVDTQKHFAAQHSAANGGGFDISLLAVGAYEPRWFMKEQHVNPAEAVQIHKDLQSKRSVGIHWGVFNLTDESLDQPPKDLVAARAAAGLKEDDFFLMALGETRKLPRRR
jgi:N-acyl-phosphatidylethanolamine-hydrolysing phospholipase D